MANKIGIECVIRLAAMPIQGRISLVKSLQRLPSIMCQDRRLISGVSYQSNILKISKVNNFFNAKRNYKALVLEELGESLKLKELKSPKKLKADEVRVAVHCCGVNNSDILMCEGKYETKPKLPFVPGFEVSGEVMEVGSKVTEFSVGDRVIGLNKESYSGFAEECIFSKKDLWQIPQSISFENAASFADCYTTVLIAARRAKIEEGDTVLVTAAGGGLGLAAVDMLSNLFKAKVFGVCGTEDKAALVRDKGAFAAINYNKKELVDAVKSQTDGVGVNVVFDAVGGDMFEDCLDCICHEGCIIVAGFASRSIPQIFTSQLLPKSCALIGISLSHYRLAVNDIYYHTVQEVIDMYQDEFFEPHISAIFKMDEVEKAFKFIEDRKSTGKVILSIR